MSDNKILRNSKEIIDKISKIEEETKFLENKIQRLESNQGNNTSVFIITYIFIFIVLMISIDETPGPRGPRGFDGAPGITTIKHQYDKVGPRGPQGVRGPEGGTIIQYKYEKIGPQGPQGIQGPIGLQGPQGIMGPIGPKGDTGIEGLKAFKEFKAQVREDQMNTAHP